MSLPELIGKGFVVVVAVCLVGLCLMFADAISDRESRVVAGYEALEDLTVDEYAAYALCNDSYYRVWASAAAPVLVSNRSKDVDESTYYYLLYRFENMNNQSEEASLVCHRGTSLPIGYDGRTYRWWQLDSLTFRVV